MDRGAWQATAQRVAESDVTEHAHTHIHTYIHGTFKQYEYG